MIPGYALLRATRLTVVGLARGRVYHHRLPTGETVTVGRHTPAVGPRGWAIYGYDRGGCRHETFELPSEAVARLFDLARRGAS